MISRTWISVILAAGVATAGCESKQEETAGEPSRGTTGVERVERGNLVIENIPEIPQSLENRLQQFQNTRSASFEDWTPDGSIIVSTRFGETTQLHQVSEPLGMRRQLTFFEEPVSNALYAPVESPHEGFLFTRDEGGNEKYQIFFFDQETSRVRRLTEGRSRNESPVWTHDGEHFAFRSNRRNGRDWDIYLASPEGGKAKRIVKGEGYWLPISFSPDDRRLAILKYVSITDTTLKVYNRDTGETTTIRAGKEPAFYAPVDFTADGSGLYLVSDAGSNYRTLRRYDFSSGEMTTLTGDVDWNVENAELSPNGEYMAYSINQGGLSKVQIRRTDDWAKVPAPNLPAGIVNGLEFNADGDRLGFTLSRATSPSDAYVYNLETRELIQWTDSEVGGLDTDRFVEPDLIHYKSFDGLEVPAFVFEPKGKGPHPVVITIHGGPESQYRPYYSSTRQYLATEMGAAVVAPNVRGSAGYGKDYVSMDNKRKREDSVRDIGALLDWIEKQPNLDEDRVAVYGGSYGGYMVLASLVHYDERLTGGVDVVGISNFVTFLENTKDYRKSVRRPEYGDERDPEMRKFLQSISPLNHADKIDSPLFVVQGANDPRVPLSEAEQMVEKIRDTGGEVWYLMAKDEGHGFDKKSNRDFQTAATMLFLEKLFSEEKEGSG